MTKRSFDDLYRQRVQDAVVKAIVEASIVELDGQPTALMKSSEIYSALVTIIAGIVSKSEIASSPTKARNLTDNFARELLRRITVDGVGFTAAERHNLQ